MISSKVHKKEQTPKYIVMKIQNTKDKEEILEAAREKESLLRRKDSSTNG